jgi:hypothetical protein
MRLLENDSSLEKKEQAPLEHGPEALQVLGTSLIDAQKHDEPRGSGLRGTHSTPKKSEGHREDELHRACPIPCQNDPHRVP